MRNTFSSTMQENFRTQKHYMREFGGKRQHDAQTHTRKSTWQSSNHLCNHFNTYTTTAQAPRRSTDPQHANANTTEQGLHTHNMHTQSARALFFAWCPLALSVAAQLVWKSGVCSIFVLHTKFTRICVNQIVSERAGALQERAP